MKSSFLRSLVFTAGKDVKRPFLKVTVNKYIVKMDHTNTLRGHTYNILCLTHGDGLVYSGDVGGTIKTWINTIKTKYPMWCLIYNDGILYSGSYKVINAWKDGKVDGTIPASDVGVFCLAFHNGMLYSGCDDPVINVWKDYTYIIALKGHTDGVNCLKFNDDILYSGSIDYTIKLWKDYTCIATLVNHRTYVNWITFGHDLMY